MGALPTADGTPATAKAGWLFGLALSADGSRIYFGDDGTNALSHVDTAVTNPPAQ